MTVLRDDIFIRRGGVREARRGAPRGLGLSVALLFVAFALVILSRLDHPYVRAVRDALSPGITGVLTEVSKPLAPIRESYARYQQLWSMQGELERLRAENRELKGWQWRAIQLEQRVNELSKAVNAVARETRPYVTARVVAYSTGPFARSAVIDAGRERLIKSGFPVINADGLVGRVVEVGEGYARVLLVNDVNSRIPVDVGKARLRAIAEGTNGARIKLRYLPVNAQVTNGAVIATSGVDGLFPSGLRLGMVVMEGGRAAVEPVTNLERLGFVSVLFYLGPSQTLSDRFSGATNRQRQIRGRDGGSQDAGSKAAQGDGS